MTVISEGKYRMNQRRAAMSDLDVSMWEGMEAAAEDAWEMGPAMALTRAAKSIFDDSETIDATKANEMFNLAGTDAQITEPITIEAARAKSEDYQRIKMNEIIKGTVNEESPILGRVTQFGASMAASMVDPVMLAANIGGAAAIGAGVRAFTANAAVQGTRAARAYSGIRAVSPGLAKAIVTSYGDDITRSWMTIMAREGAENLAGGIAEEAIIQGALTVGDERMAQKYGIKDSMQNLVAGTLMGAGFTSVFNKEARKAFSNKLLMDWGDDAPDFFHANTLMGGLESLQGHEKGRLEIDLQNMERFEAKPWHPQDAVAPSAGNSKPGVVFIPIREDGTVHTLSHRGSGTVLTSNKVQAYNTGAKVAEVHTDKLKLVTANDFVQNGKQTKIGQAVRVGLVEDMVNQTSPEKLTRAIAVLNDVDPRAVPAARMRDLQSALNEMLEGKNLDQILDDLNRIAAMSESKADFHSAIDNVLDKAGYNGYTFKGKDFDGKDAWDGVYISEKYANRAKKVQTHDVPQPTQYQKDLWLVKQEEAFKKHADWVKHKAKSLKADANDIREAVGLPRETPIDEAAAPKSKDHIQEALASSKEKVGALDKAVTRHEAKIANLRVEGKDIPEHLLEVDDVVAFAKRVKDGVDYETLNKESKEGFDKFVACALSAFFGG